MIDETATSLGAHRPAPRCAWTSVNSLNARCSRPASNRRPAQIRHVRDRPRSSRMCETLLRRSSRPYLQLDENAVGELAVSRVTEVNAVVDEIRVVEKIGHRHEQRRMGDGGSRSTAAYAAKRSLVRSPVTPRSTTGPGPSTRRFFAPALTRMRSQLAANSSRSTLFHGAASFVPTLNNAQSASPGICWCSTARLSAPPAATTTTSRPQRLNRGGSFTVGRRGEVSVRWLSPTNTTRINRKYAPTQARVGSDRRPAVRGCRASAHRLLVFEIATVATAVEDRRQTSRHSNRKEFVSLLKRAESKLGHLGGRERYRSGLLR